MAFFDFIENFFLISLGITFALILLLIYHFKQRISSMERKGDTMYELISNIVSEMRFMKQINIFSRPAPCETMPSEIPTLDMSEKHSMKCPFSSAKVVTEECMTGSELPAISNSTANTSVVSQVKVSKLIVSDDSSDSDDSDVSDEPMSEIETSSDSDDSESNTDDDSGSDYEENNEDNKLVTPSEEPSAHVDIPEMLPTIEEVAVDEIVPTAQDAEPELANTLENVTQTIQILPETQLVEHIAEQTDTTISDIDIPNQEPEEPPANTEPVLTASPESQDKKPARDAYRKMNITQLRAMASTLEIQTDTSKMKKNELIQLIESLEQ
jgi:hypothetical protein